MDYVIGFVVLLGVLVFIHEFGHFYVAKLCGMKVEVFSIGMGKKILTFTRGETEYAISLFPLGGYVKILGQDPREEIPPNEEHRSFRTKPVWQKAAVVLAGPIANLILAYFVLAFVYMQGAPTQAPIIARVLDNSPAYSAGLRSGDTVNSLQGVEGKIDFKSLSSFQLYLDEHVGQEIKVNITRNGESSDHSVLIEKTLKRHPRLGVMQEMGHIEGVEYAAPAATIVAEHQSWASGFPVPYPFQVTSIEYLEGEESKKVEVNDFFHLQRVWSEAVASQTRESGRLVLRGIPIVMADENEKNPQMPSEQEHALVWVSAEDAPEPLLQRNGFQSTEMVISKVVSGSPAAQAGLQEGDRIVALNDESIVSFQLFKRKIQELAGNGDSIKISWLRNGEVMNQEVSTRVVDVEDPITQVSSQQFQIGAAFLAIKAAPTLKSVKADGIGEAFSLAGSRTYALVATMLQSFKHLIVGDISLNTLGGPLTIAKVSGDSFTQGLVPFLQMMAFISLNLFILNLFPIPVLDGGHLVLFAVESIIRRPVSIKALEIWTTTGVVLLLMLMGVAFFNDFDRMGWIPSF